MKRIVTIVGARPQFIKAAVVSRAIAGAAGRLREKLVHTGQHHDENMSEVFFRELAITPPGYSLGIQGGLHGEMTGRMLAAIERVLIEEKPDLVLVYGDTNSTLAGALAASKLRIPLGHVEAGLRSFNMAMPEEVNRVLADRVSRWLFCPTAAAQRNLLAEGADPARIHQVGDVMYDAVLHYAARAARPAIPTPYCVATVHRAENADDAARLAKILAALDEISEGQRVVFPLHPRTRKRMHEFGIAPRRVELVDPVGYLEMIGLVSGCEAVFTDSGGLQKEAFFLNKPCITMRSETEWIELVDLGVNIVAGVEPGAIVAAWETLRARRHDWSARPYGAGDAGERIVTALLKGFR